MSWKTPSIAGLDYDFAVLPGLTKNRHNSPVIFTQVRFEGSEMSKIAQIALGAVVAICISGASVHAERTWIDARHAAQWQQAQLAVDAKLAGLETAAITGIESIVRAIVQ